MKTLYFDCFAGASGNMILGGIVALGVKPNELLEEIKRLNIPKFKILFSDVNRAGIRAIHVETRFREEKTNRHLSDIETIISNSALSEAIKADSIKIFTNLAEAEAKVHGIEIGKVHFHEVGAMDAIIDVVGAVIGFEILGVDRFACSKIHTGSGFVEIAHGKYPVPPPAVAELLSGIPIYSNEIEGELITPTGAAIVATLCRDFGAMPEMTVEKIGYGAGTREYEKFPNALRMMIGEVQASGFGVQDFETKRENLCLIETNLDDISPEILGYVMERAFEFGALDCWFTPIQMKKNRPATMISILCEKESREVFSGLLYSETTTLGVRITEIDRECIPRETQKILTEFGEAEFKVARYNGRIVNVKPEYDWLRGVAANQGLSIKDVERKVLRNFEDNLEEN